MLKKKLISKILYFNLYWKIAKYRNNSLFSQTNTISNIVNSQNKGLQKYNLCRQLLFIAIICHINCTCHTEILNTSKPHRNDVNYTIPSHSYYDPIKSKNLSIPYISDIDSIKISPKNLRCITPAPSDINSTAVASLESLASAANTSWLNRYWICRMSRSQYLPGYNV